jgi:hypothetical protein
MSSLRSRGLLPVLGAAVLVQLVLLLFFDRGSAKSIE